MQFVKTMMAVLIFSMIMVACKNSSKSEEEGATVVEEVETMTEDVVEIEENVDFTSGDEGLEIEETNAEMNVEENLTEEVSDVVEVIETDVQEKIDQVPPKKQSTKIPKPKVIKNSNNQPSTSEVEPKMPGTPAKSPKPDNNTKPTSGATPTSSTSTTSPTSSTSTASNTSSSGLKDVKETSNSSPVQKDKIDLSSRGTKIGNINDGVKKPEPEFNHTMFNGLLAKVVSSNGTVDYAALSTSKAALERYTKSLEANPPKDSWSRNKKLAYWINAYNAYTLTLITDNYPLQSITDLDGGKPWDRKWIKIGGQTYSLNNIENDIIRPRFNDARIHFAVNCAAKSCPPLANFAYTESNLNSKLEQMTKSFINGSSNKISANSVEVSKIFDWYAADFGNLINFLNKYSNTKIDAGANVSFMEYDWSLNGK